MAKIYQQPVNESIELDELIDLLRSFDKKIFDDNHIEESIHALKKLYNNRRFLTLHLNSLLKDFTKESKNFYTFQVFMIAQEKYFNVRAPIWMPASGLASDKAFIYDIPHDHNFNLITLGYLGDGYKTDIYQYDVNSIKGISGESVPIYGHEQYQLKPGNVLHMGINSDVHTQIPPNDLSISVNIMQTKALSDKQFIFDIKNNRILRKVNGERDQALLDLAETLGDENTTDIIEHLKSKQILPPSQERLIRQSPSVL